MNDRWEQIVVVWVHRCFQAVDFPIFERHVTLPPKKNGRFGIFWLQLRLVITRICRQKKDFKRNIHIFYYTSTVRYWYQCGEFITDWRRSGSEFLYWCWSGSELPVDADPDPDWDPNDADPNAEPNPSFLKLENRKFNFSLSHSIASSQCFIFLTNVKHVKNFSILNSKL